VHDAARGGGGRAVVLEREAARGPGPVADALRQARPDGVLHHVPARVVQVLLVLDRVGGEPVTEEMAPASVLLVEALGIAAVQVVHPVGEVDAPHAPDDVVVRVHQAERIDVPPPPADGLPEEGQPQPPVVVGEDDRAPVHAPGREMERVVLVEHLARQAGHGKRR
jgi:hypothetical protein